MAYTTYAGVKNYLGITSSADDALFTTLIDRAQASIDNHCRRTFEAGSDTTRLVSVEDADGLTLVLTDDLCSITSITNNADGVTETITIDTHAITVPRYDTPYREIKMLGSVNKIWDYADDPEEGISILGRWAYSTSPPANVVDVCVRLTEYLYRGKDTGEGTSLSDDTAMGILDELGSLVKL